MDNFTCFSIKIKITIWVINLSRIWSKIIRTKCAEVEEYANIVIEEAKKYFSEIEIDAGLQESFPFFIWFIYYKIKQRGLAYE